MSEEVCPICEEETSIAHECDNCGKIVCQDCFNFDDNICADCEEVKEQK